MNRQFPLHVAAALLLAALPPRASAWYQVEVIVFEYLHPDTDGEQWQYDPGMPDRDAAIELTSGDPGAGTAASPFTPYRVLSPSRYRLEGVYQSLRSSHEYRPVLHVAWEQPAYGEGPGRAVHLEQSLGVPPAADQPTVSQGAGAIVDGTLRVRSGRFLHVDLDMAYFPRELAPQTAPANAGAPTTPDHVRMQTSRKLKLNELNYLDHPLFGVLVEVSRLRAAGQPEAPQGPDTDSNSEPPSE